MTSENVTSKFFKDRLAVYKAQTLQNSLKDAFLNRAKKDTLRPDFQQGRDTIAKTETKKTSPAGSFGFTESFAISGLKDKSKLGALGKSLHEEMKKKNFQFGYGGQKSGGTTKTIQEAGTWTTSGYVNSSTLEDKAKKRL